MRSTGKSMRGILTVLTLMLAGRAMTLVFISRAGGTGAGDPPAAWLMPLVGDAVIGLTALIVGYLMIRGSSRRAWLLAVVWNILGIWDALSAYLVHVSVPWPEFFMIQIFGSSMFFAAIGMHGACLWLLSREPVKQSFGLDGG